MFKLLRIWTLRFVQPRERGNENSSNPRMGIVSTTITITVAAAPLRQDGLKTSYKNFKQKNLKAFLLFFSKRIEPATDAIG